MVVPVPCWLHTRADCLQILLCRINDTASLPPPRKLVKPGNSALRCSSARHGELQQHNLFFDDLNYLDVTTRFGYFCWFSLCNLITVLCWCVFRRGFTNWVPINSECGFLLRCILVGKIYLACNCFNTAISRENAPFVHHYYKYLHALLVVQGKVFLLLGLIQPSYLSVIFKMQVWWECMRPETQ